MREIKFRAWDNKAKVMVDWGCMMQTAFNREGSNLLYDIFCGHRLDVELMQFTGLKDKNGKEIYEGDIVRYRLPRRSYQDHRGENIPCGGYFREPLEPVIDDVIFECSCELSVGNDLLWFQDHKVEESDLIDIFESSQKNWFGDDGDLAYLIDEYDLKSADDLLEYLRPEIIGNIYENPELATNG